MAASINDQNCRSSQRSHFQIADIVLGATMPRMRDTIIGFVALFGSAIFAWHLIAGWKSGDMDVPVTSFVRGNRVNNPTLFWFCAFYNVIFLMGGVFILGNSLGLYRL